MLNQAMRDLQLRNQLQLEAALDRRDIPAALDEAMRYALLNGGKRLRALLVYAAGEMVDANTDCLDAVAAAVEAIHCYSLIHDDLPAMDDDDLRRGQATVHIKYDEATAILVGDALNTLAFEIICSAESTLSDRQARLISLELASSAGAVGMVGGQMLDIGATQKQLERGELENIHQRKTGALIKASVLCGAHCAETLTAEKNQSLINFADNLGLAFQVVDDILDIESSTHQLGKPSGSDQALGKSTYPALIGLDESKRLAENLYKAAIASLDTIGDNTEALRHLAKLILRRDH